MVTNLKNIPIVFIIGPPRSGTTLLGWILDLHPSLSTWIEPYYIWDYHFREFPHDQMSENEVNDEVRHWIRHEFARYAKALRSDIVVDKSPRNCLKIPFIKSIFPEAQYIFILRDGRDSILSINKLWEKERQFFLKTGITDRRFLEKLRLLKLWLSLRPTWHYKLQSVLFEMGPPKYWLKKKTLNQIRWGGRFGWGPRFEGWQKIIDRISLLEFNAYQWVNCARGILDNINLLPKNRSYFIFYEDLIQDPNNQIKRLFSYLGLETPTQLNGFITRIRSNNTQRWLKEFSSNDLKKIGPIIGKSMIEMKYAEDESWYQGKNI